MADRPHILPQHVVDDALAMSDSGVLDRINAECHGVTVATIRRWRRDYQRRGRPRGQVHPSVPCPRCDAAPLDIEAYAELLGWYLGDGSITRSRRDVFSLHLYNDLRYPVLNDRLKKLMRRVKPGARPHTRELSGCLVTTVGWKHWPCLFPQHGPGRKHERPIVLEPWQQAIVDAHPDGLLRGLFHSDGCRVTNWTVRPLKDGPKRYEYPRYLFSNESADIIGLCTATLDAVGLRWTAPRHNLVSVARHDDVAHLDQIVGPKS
jgi:hypothetical protein